MNSAKWYLSKHIDGELFGPVSLEQLSQWAAEASISPLDKVSCDAENWVKAPMIPELEMDYLLQVGPESYYGPTTIGAVREFLACGEITVDTMVTNCKTAETRPLSEYPHFTPQEEVITPGFQRGSVREHLQNRIRQLEEALMEERKLRATAEELRARAEARLAELLNS